MSSNAVENKGNAMERLAIYLFFDERGVVDDYVIYKLKELRKHVGNIFVISNSVLPTSEREKFEAVADTVQERKNVGFDVWGYKEALEQVGWEELVEYDEVILLNYTFFGPIFPFAEMFSRLEASDCDFWGISAHKEIAPNPYTGQGSLPLHIQSHFIAVRRKMLASIAFRDYWENMPMINSYSDSILLHETKFTEHFASQGYTYEVFLDPEEYRTDYALFTSLEETLEKRSPILKKRPFVHDPLYLERNVISLRNAMETIRANTSYDTSLIWKSVLRAAEPRALYTNMDLLEILPDEPIGALSEKTLRVAAVVHMYYADMIDEISGYLANIPVPYDLYLTTDTEDKAQVLRDGVIKANASSIEIRVLDLNQGRDMAPLFIGCADVLQPGRYDLICRLHSKQSPQDPPNVAGNFKRHMFDNLLNSPGYVHNLLSLFETEPNLGLVMPPVIHAGYPTLGHSWSINRPLSEHWAEKLGIHVPFDANTPLAPYGGMFWFRPAALRVISTYPWRISDFETEVGKVDGTLPHVLERITGYACHQAGYHVRCVLNRRTAAIGYTKLEYKLQRVASLMPGGQVQDQVDWLHAVRAHLDAEPARRTLEYHFEECVRQIRARFIARYPRLSIALKWPYRSMRSLYHRGIGSR